MFWSKKTSWNLSTVLMSVASLLLIGIGNANADFVFGTPTNLGPKVNSPSDDPIPSISGDGLELYFESYRSGGFGHCDIWVTTRATIDDEWGEATNLGPPINSSGYDGGPCIFPDGLTLYFVSERGAGLMVTRHATRSDNWGPPVALGPAINIGANDSVFTAISFDGLELYIGGYIIPRPGGFGGSDLWMSTRSAVSDAWGPPLNLGPTVNSSYHDRYPSISANDLALFFNSNRPGGHGRQDIWVTTRVTKDDDWGTPVNLGPIINSSYLDGGPSISVDGRTLYFNSTRPGAGAYANGKWDLWQAPIEPVVDFNGDGKVDGKDVLVMAEHWGENRPSCDIGPTPLGDGIIDIQDLIVLAEYIGQEVDDPTLAAHWALDETEGTTAHDGVGDNDATIMGVPVWKPHDGAVDGALELNGMTFLAAGFVLNPSDGPFCVLAWVKGGQPGQGIITQQGGVDWLMVDAVEGTVATEFSPGLCGSGPSGETAITDGDWHRIGFTWDGSVCLLYIDDVLVAEAAEDGLAASAGKSVIGCGKMMAPGTFFTGLIDDVRIYNRAVKP